MTAAVAKTARVVDSVLELVGGTPLVRLNRVVPEGAANVWAKMEQLNPGGSVADRAVFSRLATGLHSGTLSRDSTIVEASIGDTAPSLAIGVANWQLKLVLVMPASASLESRAIARAYGAEVLLTEGANGLAGAQLEAERIRSDRSASSLHLDIKLPVPKSQERDLAYEIRASMKGLTLDGVALRSGSPVAGLASALTELAPHVRIHTVDGADDSDAARKMSVRLAKEEGLLVGFSSGANVLAAIELAIELGPGRNVVTLLEDTGERYFSLNSRPA